MGFADAIRSAFANYATFSGRARRSEYWWFVLFCMLGNIVGRHPRRDDLRLRCGRRTRLRGLCGAQPCSAASFSLAVFLPSLAVTVRRLHDTGPFRLVDADRPDPADRRARAALLDGQAAAIPAPTSYGPDPIGASGGPIDPATLVADRLVDRPQAAAPRPVILRQQPVRLHLAPRHAVGQHVEIARLVRMPRPGPRPRAQAAPATAPPPAAPAPAATRPPPRPASAFSHAATRSPSRVSASKPFTRSQAASSAP